MAVLVIAEHDNQKLNPKTRSIIAAAQKLSSDVDVVVLGHEAAGVAEQVAKCAGVRKVLHGDALYLQNPLAESFAPILSDVMANYDVFLAPASTFGKNLAPRVAARLDTQQVSEITGIVDENTFVRPIYAGNAIATVRLNEAKKVITVRMTSFDPVAEEGGSASVEKIEVPAENPQSVVEFIGREEVKSDRPRLTSARVVVSGGRGVGSKDDFKLIEGLADKLGAAVGASRAAVDAGYISNDAQVGQTGKIVAPELYIAVGISGAIQHLAGIADAKTIVAINKDPDAPIFEVADYGLVADLFDAVPELTEKL